MTKRVPEIRFEGFRDDWEQRKLKEIAPLQRGFDLPKANINEGPYPVVFSNGIGGWHSEYKAKAPGVVTGRSGSIGNVVFIEQNYWPHNTSLWVTNFHNNYPQYVYYLYQVVDLSQFGTGSGVPTLNRNDVHDYSVAIPKLEEQTRIANFFMRIDDTIALHQRKLEQLQSMKDGFLQKMFPKDGEKEPEIRFYGFTDDWEQRRLGEASDVRDGTHASPKYVNHGHPMVTSKNLTSSGLDMTDVSFLTDEDFNEINKRSKVSIGDILFGMIGTIGNPVIANRADFAIKNVALIKEKSYNPITNKWLLQYLKSPSFNQFIQKENAGGTQKFIALGLIRDMILKVPGLEEQQEIGTFLEQIDNTITLHQRELELLKQTKKAFLQKMFV